MARKLFDDGTNYWPYNAVLNYSDKGYAYISGYKDAADELVNAVAVSRVTLDTIIYPICFLYRHYLELSFKALLSLIGMYFDRSDCDTFLRRPSHSLTDLWQKLKEVLHENAEDIERLNIFDDFIAEFANIDPRGTAFRYRTNIDGSLSLADNGGTPYQYLALDCLAKQMENLGGLLYCMDIEFEQRYQYRLEAMLCSQS